MIRALAYAIAGVILGYTYNHLVNAIELLIVSLIRIFTLEF